MTRIIAGAARGRVLTVPAAGTRPTSDRAREGLFNSVATLLDLEGARVLDLFAGTGAVGLEALSRGAAGSTFVESDREVAAVLRANIGAVRLPGATLVRSSVQSYLTATADPQPFDLVFADPPYALEQEAVTALLTALSVRWLAPGTLVVVERSARSAELSWPDVIQPIKQKRYGEGLLWYGRRR